MRLSATIESELMNKAFVCLMCICVLAKSDTAVAAVILDAASRPAKIEKAIESNGGHLVNVIDHLREFRTMLIRAHDIIGDKVEPFEGKMEVFVARMEARSEWQKHQFGMMNSQLVGVWSRPVTQDDD